MNLFARLFLALSFSSLLTAQTKYQLDVMSMNPLGFWPLNGNTIDVTSNGNGGTIKNGAFFSGLFTSPVEPQSLVLAGPDKPFIQMPTAGSSIFNLGSLHAMTAIAWVKTVSQGNGLIGIVGKADPVTSTGWLLGIDNSDSGDPGSSGRLVLLFLAGGNATLAVEAPNARNDGGWHMLAATYDGSGSASGVKLYINGLPVSSPIVGVDSVSGGSILNSAPLTIGADTSGNAHFDGALSGVAVFGTALTPAQVLQLADDAASAKAYLGQFAFGGGWYSALYFTNIGIGEVSFPVTFTADNGTPLSVPNIGSSKTITLAAGASTVIEAPNTGALQQGYVSVTVPVGVTGYGVFRQSVAGVPDQEAVVPLSVPGGNVPLVFDETKYIFGVSIVNPGSVSTSVTITATDNTGAVIATSQPIVIPAFNKKVDALRNLPGLSGVVGKQGTVRFVSTGSNVVVLGLRFNGSAFTSIPAQPQSQIFKFIGAP